MITKEIIFNIHQLKSEGFSSRKIANSLQIDRKTVKRHLANHQLVPAKRGPKGSILDPYKPYILELLEKDPLVQAPVILEKIMAEGYKGEITILRYYLREKRGAIKVRRPHIRFESEPGQQIQIDWGHFGVIRYGDTSRKLYALAVIESYSRMLYIEFTHSMKQQVLHQALLKAFRYFGGTSKEIVVDNMLTAVSQRVGSVVRFNDAFLEFLTPFYCIPKACAVRQPQQKGKIENAIKYLRNNFIPLRSFSDLKDIQTQVLDWLLNTCNNRIHQTTGQRPVDRFKDVKLSPLPEFLPDCFETENPIVHPDFGVRFDGNVYTAPPWCCGKKVTLKADLRIVHLFLQEKKIATHTRCYERKKRIELLSHVEQVKKLQKSLWHDKQISCFAALGADFRDYLESLVSTKLPIKKQITRLLNLVDQYDKGSVHVALLKAKEFGALGADVIENILFQEMIPKRNHSPVKLKNQALNQMRLTEPGLADYDSIIVKKRKQYDR